MQVGETTPILDTQNLEDIVKTDMVLYIGGVGIHHETGGLPIALGEEEQTVVGGMQIGIGELNWNTFQQVLTG